MNIDELYTVEHHEKGAEMQVRNEDGKKLDMFITLAGIDSKLWRNAFNSHKKELIDGNEDADAKLYAEVTLGWRGFMSKDKELEFSKKKAEQLYVNAPYIMGQVDKFIADRGNFTKS